MKKADIISHLLYRAAYEDTLGPTSEGAILRKAAVLLLEQEVHECRSNVEKLLERLDNGIQPR